MKDNEDGLLRSVALQNANTILLARQRAEQALIQAKEELRESNERITSILESITDGFIVIGRDWCFTYINQRAEEILRPLHKSRNHLLGKNFWQEFPDLVGTALDQNYRRTMERQVTVEFDFFYPALDRWFEIRAYPAKTGVSVYFQDITKRKQAEHDNVRLYEAAQKSAVERTQLLESEQSARAQAERMSELKDEFLANLSHELRTPLNAIFGWAQILCRRVQNDAELRQGLEIIERNARTQTRLIEDLLDMSRIAAGKVRLDVQPVEPVSFIEAALETVRPAANAKGIRLESLLDPAAGPISGDPGRLQQIVWNLLANAIKFTGKGGKVRVLLERVDSHIEISVADTGIGIKPEFLPYVFERFRQADATLTRVHGGLGLGLSIVKHLVELHGGTVQAESPGDGGGATFGVRLPLMAVLVNSYGDAQRHPKTAETHSMNSASPDLAGIKVLVVEDEADARDLIKRVLTDCGASVITARNADEALRLVEKEKPHLLMSDIGMPDVDGYELLRRVRALGAARGGRMPAIALTAFARSEDRTRALRAGFQVHIAKPVEPSELLVTVANVAGRTGH